MSSKVIQLDSGLSYIVRTTHTGSQEVRAVGLPAAVAAISDMMSKGYTPILDPTDRTDYPLAAGSKMYIFFEGSNADTNNDGLSVTSSKEQASETSTQEEKEGQSDQEDVEANVELEAPNWVALEKLSKTALEDYADKFSVQLDPSKMNKKEMLEAFKEAYEAKNK